MVTNRIAKLRKEAGLNQYDLAEVANVTASAIVMYEQGRRTPSLKILIILVKYFDMSLDYPKIF